MLDEGAERDALRTLAVFGSRLPAACRAIVAVLSSAGQQLLGLAAVQPSSGTSSNAVAAARAVLERRLSFAEGQLALALNRSGSLDADGRLALAEEERRAGDDAQPALLALTQLHPHWGLGWRKLSALRREGLGGEGVPADAEALGWLRQATRLAPHDVFAWLELGHALKASGDVRGALGAYREAQSRHPTLSALKRLQQWLTAAQTQVGLKIK